VECFCVEEQRLLAGEDDPNVRDVKDVVLSYTFFAARRNKKTGQMEPDTDLENVSAV
jgi:cytochrome c oxidase assembly protein subunit 11